MLILSRKLNEAIVIGRNIEVTVLEIRGDRVKLGIQGPLEVSVHRGEVQARIEASRQMETASSHLATPLKP